MFAWDAARDNNYAHDLNDAQYPYRWITINKGLQGSFNAKVSIKSYKQNIIYATKGYKDVDNLK